MGSERGKMVPNGRGRGVFCRMQVLYQLLAKMKKKTQIFPLTNAAFRAKMTYLYPLNI
jgi:hypothetical protein